jgi:hypothetical protein
MSGQGQRSAGLRIYRAAEFSTGGENSGASWYEAKDEVLEYLRGVRKQKEVGLDLRGHLGLRSWTPT